MRTLTAALLLAGILSAQADDLRQPGPGVHALVDVRIVPRPGEIIESGTIVIRDGIIESVGSNVQPPPDARLHRFERADDQDPVTVYAGLIEPYLLVDTAPNENNDDNLAPPGRHELVNPDFHLGARHWPEDRVGALRQAGFTTALLTANAGIFRGHGTVANLGDGGLSANLLVDRFGQFASFEARSENHLFPGSLMGAVALARQTLADAQWQAAARTAWRANPAQPRPEWLEGLDDLAPVLDGSTPLVFDSQDLLDSLRIMELIESGRIDLVLVGHGYEYQRLGALTDRPVRHILPLDFPQAPDARDEDDRNVSLEELRHWHRAADNPRLLTEAGVPLLLTSTGLSQPGQIFEQLTLAIERGFNRDQALAALTTEPARWLGLDDRAGTIRAGAMANLVVVEGELFAATPAISEVWVDGHRHVLAAFEPPTVDPAGTWALTLGLGEMGDVDATLDLTGPPTSMRGTLTVMGSEVPLSEVRVRGDRVNASVDAARFGGAGTISIRVEIDGDRARGTGSGPFGEFTVRGRRTSRPDEEETI